MINVIMGFVGLTLMMVAFILNILKKLATESIIYNLLNLAGAIALAYYSYSLSSMPFLILQIMWGIFALYNLIRTI